MKKQRWNIHVGISTIVFLTVAGIIVFFAGFVTGSANDIFQLPEIPSVFHSETSIRDNLDLVKKLIPGQLSVLKVRKSFVFPHDFMNDDTDWKRLQEHNQKLGGNTGVFALTPEEKYHISLQKLCRDIGHDVTEKDQFLVFSIVYDTGINMKDENIDAITYDESRDALVLPEMQILDFKIEEHENGYAYPEYAITAAQWQQLISLVLPRVLSGVLTDEYKDKSEARLRSYVKGILKKNGYESIQVQFGQ